MFSTNFMYFIFVVTHLSSITYQRTEIKKITWLKVDLSVVGRAPEIPPRCPPKLFLASRHSEILLDDN